MAVFLGKTNNELCPVTALTTYLAVRGGSPGPFFRFRDERPLTRESFVARVRSLISEAGLNPCDYAGHSFRIGAASTAAACGVNTDVRTVGECSLPVVCSSTMGEIGTTI